MKFMFRNLDSTQRRTVHLLHRTAIYKRLSQLEEEEGFDEVRVGGDWYSMANKWAISRAMIRAALRTVNRK